jgi:hypothetical protein
MRNPLKLTALLMVVLAVVVLIAFNPEMPDFQVFVETQSERILVQETGNTALGQLLSGAGASLLGGMIDQVTERDNYVLFSIYTIDLDGPDEEANEWQFLGIAGQFFETKQPEAVQQQDSDAG